MTPKSLFTCSKQDLSGFHYRTETTGRTAEEPLKQMTHNSQNDSLTRGQRKEREALAILSQTDDAGLTGITAATSYLGPPIQGMAPVRLRHPNGVSTIQIPLDDDNFTVGDFQQQILSSTNILPSRQIVKIGYPPKPLTLVSELPISSLGIKSGEQIIVNEGPASGVPVSSAPPSVGHSLLTRSPLGQNPPPLSSSPSRDAFPSSSEYASGGPDFVETSDGGFLVHRVVPDDNSCLFSATALIFEQNMNKAQDLRKVVAEGIRSDPVTYNEAILGMPPEKYIQTILKPSAWGGAIELSILASHYRAEIASIDVETGRIDHFTPGENGGSGMRCILIYSGIHYDAASLAPMVDAPSEWHQTLFPVESPDDDSDPILMAAKKLADILRAKRAYTNTSTFDLKCEQCGKGLKGEKEARAHAEQTGHTRFGEY